MEVSRQMDRAASSETSSAAGDDEEPTYTQFPHSYHFALLSQTEKPYRPTSRPASPPAVDPSSEDVVGETQPDGPAAVLVLETQYSSPPRPARREAQRWRSTASAFEGAQPLPAPPRVEPRQSKLTTHLKPDRPTREEQAAIRAVAANQVPRQSRKTVVPSSSPQPPDHDDDDFILAMDDDGEEDWGVVADSQPDDRGFEDLASGSETQSIATQDLYDLPLPEEEEAIGSWHSSIVDTQMLDFLHRLD